MTSEDDERRSDQGMLEDEIDEARECCSDANLSDDDENKAGQPQENDLSDTDSSDGSY